MNTYIYIYLYVENRNIYKHIYYIPPKSHIFYKRCAPKFCTGCVSGNVCACLFCGVNCRFTFQDFESIFAF